jgi:hypothetical protein
VIRKGVEVARVDLGIFILVILRDTLLEGAKFEDRVIPVIFICLRFES